MKLYVALVFLWSISFSGFTQELKLRIPKGGQYIITDLSFSPNGKYVLTTHLNNHDFLWEVESGKFIGGVKSLTTTNWTKIRKSEFSKDGMSYLSLLDRIQVAVDKIYEGKLDFIPFSDTTYSNYAHTYYDAHFSPDGRQIITATSDSTIELWDVNSAIRIAKISGHGDHVSHAQFSPNGELIVSSSWDSTIKIWSFSTDAAKIKEVHSLNINAGLITFSISKNSQYILASFMDTTLKVFDLNKGLLISELSLTEIPELEEFSVQSNKVIVAVGQDLILWDFMSDKVDTLAGHRGKITHFAQDSSGLLLASASADSSIILWGLDDLEKRSEHKTELKPIKLVFSPKTNTSDDGGEYLLYASGAYAYLLKVENWQKTNEFKTKTSALWNSVPVTINNERFFCLYGPDSTLFYLNQSNGKIEKKVPLQNELRHLSLMQGGKFLTLNQNGGYSVNEINNFEPILKSSFSHLAYYSKFCPSSLLLATTDFDGNLSIHKLESDLKSTSQFKIPKIDNISSFDFNVSGTKFLAATIDGQISLWNIDQDKITRKWTFEIPDFVDEEINEIQFSNQDKYALIGTSIGSILLLDLDTRNVVKNLGFDYANPSNFLFNKDQSKLITCAVSSVSLWDFSEDTLLLLNEFLFDSDVYEAYFSDDEQTISAASVDGSFRIWNAGSGEEIIRNYFFESDPEKWVHLHSSGLFDASPAAMEMMYWTKGLEVIEFTQLKDRYWVPGLWEKVMNGEPLPDVRSMQELKLQPLVELGEINDGKIPVTLTKREGGYGKVSILINGKEVQADARGEQFDSSKETQTIWIDINGNPNLKDSMNVIAVKASSEDGFVVGRSVEKKVLMNLQTSKPKFYAVVIGTGKFVNEKINLKYPEKDAQSMSTALQLGAEQLFGKENTHIYTLTTASGDRPTKEKIKYVFTEISKKATSSDLILIYLSGHGIAWGGDQGDFYYLTTDATAANADAYNDELLRKNYTISSTEFTEYLKSIPANKQVMIIDACSSGKAVDNLMAARDIDVSSIKAIDRMKDRTGMFVISGSAADAVSYEASRYGQGLLTYSVLQAMKGAALRDGQFFDVNAILNYSRENVPKLAAGIGGIQTPQLLVPKGGSFDIGRVDEAAKEQIPLSNVKPVFVRTTFVDAEAFTDDLNLSKLLDDKLNQIAMRGSDGQLVFLDTREFPDAYRLSGGYTQSNGTITLKLKIKGPNESEHTLSAKTKEELLEQVLGIVVDLE